MPNLTALAANTTKALSLSNLILVSPQSTVGYQPQNPPTADGLPSTAKPPPSFLFDYEGEQSLLLESDITDHYVETNEAVQDQIALRPEIFTAHGFIGELNDVVPAALKPLKIAADKLTTVVAYQPGISVTAELAYAQAFQAYQVASNLLNTAVSSWDSLSNVVSGDNGQAVIGGSGSSSFNFSSGSFNGLSVQSKQQLAFQKFYGYWKARTLFTVQTPWAVFQNMAIKSLRAVQDEDTRTITNFECSFKMIRNASTIVKSGADVSLSGRLGAQASGLTDLGTSSGVPGPSVASSLASSGVA